MHDVVSEFHEVTVGPVPIVRFDVTQIITNTRVTVSDYQKVFQKHRRYGIGIDVTCGSPLSQSLHVVTPLGWEERYCIGLILKSLTHSFGQPNLEISHEQIEVCTGTLTVEI